MKRVLSGPGTRPSPKRNQVSLKQTAIALFDDGQTKTGSYLVEPGIE